MKCMVIHIKEFRFYLEDARDPGSEFEMTCDMYGFEKIICL